MKYIAPRPIMPFEFLKLWNEIAYRERHVVASGRSRQFVLTLRYYGYRQPERIGGFFQKGRHDRDRLFRRFRVIGQAFRPDAVAANLDEPRADNARAP
jgi:hypothetical protein